MEKWHRQILRILAQASIKDYKPAVQNVPSAVKPIFFSYFNALFLNTHRLVLLCTQSAKTHDRE